MDYIKSFQELPRNTKIAVGAASLTAAVTASYLASLSPKPFPKVVDFGNQSKTHPDGSRTNHLVQDGKSFKYFMYDDAKTTYENFKRGHRLSKDGKFLGTRNGPNKSYTWLTYDDVYEKVKDFGAGLIQEGLSPGCDTIVGIYSANRVEWVVAEQACARFSMVSCALYDTLGPDSCSYIINQTEMQLVICDTSAKAQLLLKQAEVMKSLKCIVVMDKISNENIEVARDCGVKLISFDQVMRNGRDSPHDAVVPKPEDMAAICYTSGTTGDPKGVMLTHRNCMSNIGAVQEFAIHAHIPISASDRHLSYLPLAHMFERDVQMLLIMNGGQIGFSSGDVRLLVEDMQALKPTIFATVPRLLNRMYDKVFAGVKGSTFKSIMLQWGLNSKENELKRGIIRKNSIWDKLVFRKVQDTLGGCVRLAVTGSAPVDTKVLNFARCAFGCPVFEGYGQTECVAAMTFTIPGDFNAGHCGVPLPCNAVKMVDVPEMEYFARDGQGEICCKGPNVFIGYYKNEEKTRETIDEDGWLHTGDIGQWLPNGTMKIIDRKKNIFKLAQGEYVAAEKIETTYMRSQFVAQAFVEGDSLQPYLMGIMVPDEEMLVKYAQTAQRPVPGNFKDMCANTEIKEMILKDINAIGKKEGLKGFEMVKDIVLYAELFSVENGLLTPTFKNKRAQLRKFFKSQVQGLYAKHAQPS